MYSTLSIIANEQEKQVVESIKQQFTDYLQSMRIDFVPVLLVDGRYAYPSSLLDDPRFDPVKVAVEKVFPISEMTIKEVYIDDVKKKEI